MWLPRKTNFISSISESGLITIDPAAFSLLSSSVSPRPLPLLFKQSVELGLRVTAFGNETLSSLFAAKCFCFRLFPVVLDHEPDTTADQAAAARIPITIRRIFAGNPVFTSLLPA